MRSFKLVLGMPDGGKVWINIPQMLKWRKPPMDIISYIW